MALHAIVYINGTVYDLNSLLTGAGCSPGFIVGTGLPGGTEHGFVLVPQH